MTELKPCTMNIKIYPVNVWRNVRITYDGKKYTIDDGSDYFLKQIHKLLNK